ncbi:hypothetical protein Bca101_066449 [Brassica carinata]
MEINALWSSVRIPESNNSDLIAANFLTIIGRVTNPQIQRPRAVVDFLPQVWNLEGRVQGRPLGADKFQFKFETEEDLLLVLRKGPYHYKKWMLLMQRWEPLVSPQFPSTISFWVHIHGIPLHFWNDMTVNSIGDALGNCPERDGEGAKLRLDANGLLPLEMTRDIQLPSGEVTEVEFEYIKLEKHCFQCHSLLHEKDDCPSLARGDRPCPLGINQRNALLRIEADKRRHDERRGYTGRQATHRSTDDIYSNRASVTTGRVSADHSRSDHRYSHHLEHRYSHHSGSQRIQNNERRSQRNPDPSRGHSELIYRPRDTIATKRTITGTSGELGRNLNVRLGTTEPQTGPNWSQASHTPPPRQMEQQQLSANSGNSRDRRSALGRISEPRLPAQARLGVTSSLESARLQEVDIQYLGDEDQENLTRRLSQTSPAILVDQVHSQAAEGEEDTISEDLAPRRIHPSLRIGARVSSPAGSKRKVPVAVSSSRSAEKTASKAVGKRKVNKSGKRVPQSPLGVSLRKVNAARSRNPPRKKLCLDKDQGGPSTIAARTRSSNTVPIPSVGRGGGDFRPPLPPLP